MPDDLGAAVIVVNHLRTVETHLHEILSRYTGMPVDLITDGMRVRPNQVFIIPSNRDLHILDGAFRLHPLSKPRGWPDVITICLLSLAQHWGGQLIAVIMSGLDGDGAAAMCRIKGVGGITIAQAPGTAGHAGMPDSAIASGCIDFILPPEAIARKIVELTS